MFRHADLMILVKIIIQKSKFFTDFITLSLFCNNIFYKILAFFSSIASSSYDPLPQNQCRNALIYWLNETRLFSLLDFGKISFFH